MRAVEPAETGGVAGSGRRADRLRGLRRGRADDRVAAVDADRPFAPVEGPGPLPEPSPPGRRVRRSRQRTLGPPDGPRRLPRCVDWSATSRRSWTRRAPRRRSSSDCAATGCGGRSSWPRRSRNAFSGSSRSRPASRSSRRRTRGRSQWSFEDELPTDEGWAKVNRHYCRRDYPGFARFFFEAITSEPHSTKQIEDAVEWALDGSVEAMIADIELDPGLGPGDGRGDLPRRPLPDAPRPRHRGHTASRSARSQRLAELTGAPLVVVEGADHMIPGRHPVLANLLIRDFIRSLAKETIQ